MTLAWALIIVAILFLLHKYQVLGKALRTAGILAAVLVLGFLAWVAWSHLSGRWEERQRKALFVRTHDCLNLYSGKIRPVGPSDEAPCEPFETLHETGAAIDQWALLSDLPTVPPGEYFVTDGESNFDGGPTTPARLCVDSNTTRRCYSLVQKNHVYSTHAKAEEVKYTKGNKMILFTAADVHGNSAEKSAALLANRRGELQNLLPEIDDLDESQVWNLSDVSAMPIIVTTKYDWDIAAECHVCPHRVRITSYVYDTKSGRYAKFDEYETPTKHLWLPYENVLESEKDRITTGLKSAMSEEAARHLTINP